MSDSPQHSRRQLLSWFAAAPFLPLGATATASLLTGCDDDNNDQPAPVKAINFKSASFTAMPAPSAVADIATTVVGSKLAINWDDGTKTEYQLGYKPFFLTGTEVPDGKGNKVIAGGYYDINNNPIQDTTVAGSPRQYFSDSPDGSSLLTVPNAKVDGVKGNPVFAVVQFEYTSLAHDGVTSTYGRLPSPIAVLSLDQDPKTGHLSLVKYHNVDTSSVHGLWITCGASLSPWGTHLSSEEYEPDAWNQGMGGSNVDGSSNGYFPDYAKNLYTAANAGKANPYNYGHLPEVTVNTDGTGSIKKHYCLGRISHELIQVFPDNRTALMGDDATNGGLFLFVADKEKDLSAGTLYVAKYTTLLSDTSTGKISWIKLGHATSQEIDDLVNKTKIQKEDILDSVTVDPANAEYKKVTLQKKTAWVKIKNEKAAAFLETHRYAAYKGGSLAFTKNEGTTVNAADKKAYSALANIQDSMVEGGSGYVAEHNVKFPKIVAGGILEHKLASGQVDSDGNAINSEWVPSESSLLLRGEDLFKTDGITKRFDNLGNSANPDKIASPDNLKFSEKLRTLFIGEDSGNHLNNFLWAYNVDSKELIRILSTPAGAESTGLHAVDEINGWTYIMSNFQHPGDEWYRFYSASKDADGNVIKDADGLEERSEGLSKSRQITLDTLLRDNYNNKFSAAVGYITADPLAPSIVKK